MPLGKEVGLGPGHIVLDGDPVGTQPPTAAPPHFRPMPIVAKRSPISATAELLLYLQLHHIHKVPFPSGVRTWLSPYLGLKPQSAGLGLGLAFGGTGLGRESYRWP